MAGEDDVRSQVLKMMEERGVTVNAVARKMGRRESAVRAWLYGQREDAKISTLTAVLGVLGMRVAIVNGGSSDGK